jgi:ABC-type transport system involved in multi-copper enzyme maturation permease subunit
MAPMSPPLHPPLAPRRPSRAGPLAALLWAGAAGCAWGFGDRLTLPQQLALWGLLLVAGAVVLRRGWVRPFGPVLLYDLIRTGRRTRYHVVRNAYAALLLAVLLAAFAVLIVERGGSLRDLLAAAPLPPAELARFAASFFYTFMGVQFLAVFALTPAYTAGVLAEEKERRTLEFLLATDLGNREVVLGLALSRLANLALVVLTGLPVLAFLQFLGGVDPHLVLAGFAATGLTMASLAGLGLLNSVHARRPHDAVLRTYLVAAGYLALSSLSWLLLLPQFNLAMFPSTDTWTSPVEVKDVVEWLNIGNLGAALYQIAPDVDALLPEALRRYAWFHGAVAVACCALAVFRLRAQALRQQEVPAAKAAGGRRQRARRLPLWGRPRVGHQPVLWKEAFVDAGARRGPLLQILKGVLVAGLFWPAVHLVYFYGRVWPTGPADDLGRPMNVWVRAASMALGCFLLLQVALRAAGSVSGERDRQTLDGLLATPLENPAILCGKWAGSILCPRAAWVWLALVWAVGLFTGAVHWLAVPCFLLAWLVLAAALAALGLWCSVAARTTHRAIFLTLLTVTAVMLSFQLGYFDLAGRWLKPFEAQALLPPYTLGLLAFSPAEYREWAPHVLKLERPAVALVLMLLFWSLAAAGGLGLAGIRFRVATGRKSAHPTPLSPDGPLPAAAAAGAGPAGDRPAPKSPASPVNRGRVQAAPPATAGPVAGRSAHPPAWSRWGRRFVALVPVLLPLGLLLAWYAHRHVEAEDRLRAAIAEADRLDHGWRLEELEAARAVVPDEQNSAPQVSRAAELLRKGSKSWQDSFKAESERARRGLTPDVQLSGKHAGILAAVLKEAEQSLVEARRLADMPRGRHASEWDADNASFRLPHLGQVGSVADLLKFDALFRAQNRHADGALTSCRGILNAGRSIGDEPFLISQFVRMQNRGTCLGCVERILAQGEPTDAALAALQLLLEEEDRQPCLLLGARGDRAFTDAAAQAVRRGNGLNELRGLSARASAWPPTEGELEVFLYDLLQEERAALLAHQTAVVEAAKLPAPKDVAGLAALYSGKLPRMVRFLAGALDRVAALDQRTRALLRCTLAALAVERYRLQHGRWPESLAALAPSPLPGIPADPYDGRPLRYRLLADGVVIYCVGQDLTDNGGKLDHHGPGARANAFGTDVGLRLWDVPQRRKPVPAKTAPVGPPPVPAPG